VKERFSIGFVASLVRRYSEGTSWAKRKKIPNFLEKQEKVRIFAMLKSFYNKTIGAT
jgi:hypothetical protein